MMDEMQPGWLELLENFLMGRGALKKANKVGTPNTPQGKMTPRQDTTELQRRVKDYMAQQEAQKKKKAPDVIPPSGIKRLSGGGL